MTIKKINISNEQKQKEMQTGSKFLKTLILEKRWKNLRKIIENVFLK